MDSPEYKTLTQCFPNLFTCVKQSPNHVVVQLRPSGILAPDMLAFLDNPSNNNDDKAKKIIDSVLYQVQINPKIFYTFVSALKASGSWTETVVSELEHTHTSLSAPTNTQTPTPLPVDSRDGDDQAIPLGQAAASTGSMSNVEPNLTPEFKAEAQELDLESQSQDMEYRFSALMDSILRSLESRQISKERLVACLTGIKSLKKVYDGSNQCLFRRQKSKLNRATSLAEVWIIIDDYISFFDYEIVLQIVASLGSKEDQRNIEQYGKVFQEYIEKRVVPMTISSRSTRDDSTQFIVKLDATYDGCEIGRLKRLERKLSNLLNLNPGVLKLSEVRRGSIVLVFEIPVFIVEDIFPLLAAQEELKELGIVQLSCGDYHYPPSTQETEDDSKKSFIKHGAAQIRSSGIPGRVKDGSAKTEDEKRLSPSSEAVGPEQATFPYLDVSGLTEEERIALEEQLKVETFKIKSHFTRLTSDVIRCLEHSENSLDDFKDFIIRSIKRIKHFSSSDNTGVKVFDEEDEERIEAAKNFSDVFMIVNNYISFFNHSLIERIIDHFGTDSDQDKLEEYLKAFRVFCKRSVFEVPHDAFASSTRAIAKAFVLKCTEDVAQMEGVVRVTNEIADVLRIPTEALQLRSIKKGCVELHFLISAAVADRIFPVSPSQHSALSEIGVRVLSFDGKNMGSAIPQEVLSNIDEISPSYDLFHKAHELCTQFSLLLPASQQSTASWQLTVNV